MTARRLLQLLCIAALAFGAAGLAAAQVQPSSGAKPATARATFAGGCFWRNIDPTRYKFYKSGCGREVRLQQLWGKPGS